MGLTRRDALKVAAVGGAAVALPLERAFGEVKVYANRIAESELPAPFTVPFSVPFSDPCHSGPETDL